VKFIPLPTLSRFRQGVRRISLITAKGWLLDQPSHSASRLESRCSSHLSRCATLLRDDVDRWAVCGLALRHVSLFD
jgi:hypothetical protein